MPSSALTAIVALSTLGLATSAIGRPVAHPALPAAPGGPPDSLVVDARASSIRWQGAGLGARDTGTVNPTSGLLVIRHERLTSGTLVVDMRRVALSGGHTTPAAWRLAGGPGLGAVLDVVRSPAAVFRSTGATRVGEARWRVTGELTLRGVTRPVTFDADVAWPELGHLVATSAFTIDRREWGIADAGDGAIRLAVTLDARRKPSRVAMR